MKKPKSVLIGMTILCGISVANIGYSFAEEPIDKIVDEYTDIRPYQPIDTGRLSASSIIGLLKDISKVKTNSDSMRLSLKEDSESTFQLMVPKKLAELKI